VRRHKTIDTTVPLPDRGELAGFNVTTFELSILQVVLKLCSGKL